MERRPYKKLRETINGKVYTSFQEISKDYNINLNTLITRYNRGSRGGELVKETRKKLPTNTQIDDGDLISLKALAKKHGRNYQTVLNRYHRGLRGEDLVNYEPYRFEKSINISIDGQTYTRFKDVSDKFGISVQTIRRRYKAGLRGLDLVAKRLPKKTSKEKPKKQRVTHTIEIAGRIFTSFLEIAEYYGVKSNTVRVRYNRGLRGLDLVFKNYATPKWIRYDRKHQEYKYQRTYKGQTVAKARKDLKEIKAISKLVDDYIKIFDRLPELGNDRVKLDYNTVLGKRFGELTVIGVLLVKNRRKLCCKCSCGKEVCVVPSSVVSGKVVSCGHLEGWALKEKNEDLKNIQRSSDKALSSNKSTGHRYISYNSSKQAYDFEITRYKTRLRKRFYNLEEAISFKTEILEAIKRNDGKIPRQYL